MSDSLFPGASLHTRSGVHRLGVQVAQRFWSRFMGLMLRKALPRNQGLLLTGCPSVHTAFMRFAIDVVYLDAQGVVTRCVPALRPWSASMGHAGRDAAGQRHPRAAHTLELAAGSVARWAIAPGDRLQHPLLDGSAAPEAPAAPRRAARRAGQRGIAVLEFAIAAPVLTVLGLGVTQYSLLFFTKSQLNQASFMAARAGSVANAKLGKIEDAYAQALIPLYGGGQNATELAEALARAKADMAGNVQITMINPTKEAFADFNDPALQAKLNTQGKRVIPNSSLAFKGQALGASSGETIQDANLIKLRVMQGVKPKVPVVGSIYTAYLKWQDNGTDAFRTKLIQDGRIPVVSHVTMQMQSDAIEPENPISIPGTGNNGNPTDPGDPPGPANPNDPPDCPLGGCATPTPTPGDGGTCPAASTATLGSDTLFGFDQSTLTQDGKDILDKLVANIGNTQIDTLTVTGYADPLGNDAHNLALSKARAQAVYDYLAAKGIKADKVNVVGAGATDFVKELSACQPATGAALQSCLAPNRRVVVKVKPKT